MWDFAAFLSLISQLIKTCLFFSLAELVSAPDPGSDPGSDPELQSAPHGCVKGREHISPCC